MKQALIILSMLLIGFQQSVAQGSTTIESFNSDIMPQYLDYFNRAELTGNGQLQLTATGKYILLTMPDKKNMMNGVVKSWQESLVLIHLDSKSELWGWNNDSGTALLLDSWDLSSPIHLKMSGSKMEGTSRHPWFFYLGGMTYIDSNKNFDAALNAHVGFFLLLDRWDLSASYSETVKGTITTDETSGSGNTTGQLSLGLLSKVYFPIKQLNISPNIGGEIDFNFTTNVSTDAVSTLTPSLLLGVSWYVGIGSLDIGCKIGNGVTTLIGYTIIPGFGQVKKKHTK
jgi:hypothetical protein